MSDEELESTYLLDSKEETITTDQNTEDINIFLAEYNKNKSNNKTPPYLNKYERTRVLSERAQQIIDGSPIFISHPETYKNP